LHEDGIYARLLQLAEELAGVGKFGVVDDGIHGHVDLRSELMGVAAERGNIVHRITGSGTRTEARCSDVDGVGAMLDGCQPALQVLGRGQ